MQSRITHVETPISNTKKYANMWVWWTMGISLNQQKIKQNQEHKEGFDIISIEKELKVGKWKNQNRNRETKPGKVENMKSEIEKAIRFQKRGICQIPCLSKWRTTWASLTHGWAPSEQVSTKLFWFVGIPLRERDDCEDWKCSWPSAAAIRRKYSIGLLWLRSWDSKEEELMGWSCAFISFDSLLQELVSPEIWIWSRPLWVTATGIVDTAAIALPTSQDDVKETGCSTPLSEVRAIIRLLEGRKSTPVCGPDMMFSMMMPQKIWTVRTPAARARCVWRRLSSTTDAIGILRGSHRVWSKENSGGI